MFAHSIFRLLDNKPNTSQASTSAIHRFHWINHPVAARSLLGCAACHLQRTFYTRQSRLMEHPNEFYRMCEADGAPAPNSETRVELLEQRGDWARYRLTPVTGKRHQLRVHMNALGLPIVGDQLYPVVRHGPDEPEDFQDPLRLLAKAIAFTDPVTGEARRFESPRSLVWPA